jgi:hypothetical protein
MSMRSLILGGVVLLCLCAGACKVTKREGGDTSWRRDGSAAPASPTRPDEFPTASSPAPSAAELEGAIPFTVEGWDAPCTTSRVREWLRVSCPKRDRPLEGVELVHSRGFGSDVTTIDTPELAAAVLPVRAGGDIKLTFHLPDGARDLSVLWSARTQKPSISFKKDSFPHDKLRCNGPSKSGPCCYRAWSGTSFHPELQCDRTRYQEICKSNGDCDSRTQQVCRPGPAGTGLSLCALP